MLLFYILLFYYKSSNVISGGAKLKRRNAQEKEERERENTLVHMQPRRNKDREKAPRQRNGKFSIEWHGRSFCRN